MDVIIFRLPVFLKKCARSRLAIIVAMTLLFSLACLPAMSEPVKADPATADTAVGEVQTDSREGQTAAPDNESGAVSDPVAEQGHDSAQDQEQEQAVYPGVRNECLRIGGNGKPAVILYYPAFGLDAVDADIAAFALGLANDFVNQSGQENGSSPETELEDGGSGRASSEMTGYYELNKPSEKIASLTFSLYSYTGGAHGNLEIVCLNYDLANASRLALADLFANQEKALEIMSGLARSRLARQLGNEAEEDMLTGGTMPTAENFSCLTLIYGGVRVEFPPYQVAPWFAGPQKVMINLPELAGAKPSTKVWPAAANLSESKGDATRETKPESSGPGGSGEEIP